MPDLEMKITDLEMKILNDDLEKLASMRDNKKEKRELFHHIHCLFNRVIQEAFEVGKDVGNAGL